MSKMNEEQGISKLAKIALISLITTSLVLAPYTLTLPSPFFTTSKDVNIKPYYDYQNDPAYKSKIPTVE